MLSVEKQMLYLLSRTESMEVNEMIRIYEKREYSAQYIRNTLSHLKKESFVSSPTRSTYCITNEGRSYIQSINRKPHLYNSPWDGAWHTVMIELPESERKKRDRFRSDMLQIGFGLLYSSVYLSPWPYHDEINQLIDKYEMGNRLTSFSGKLLYREITPEEASAIWKLNDVEQCYRTKWSWFQNEFQMKLEQSLRSSDDPLAPFLLYLHLGEIISELYLVDPMLPAQLLPDEWICKDILQALLKESQKLAAAISPDSPYARFVK